MSTELANAHTRPWAFYGATGVTGRMILERALARGHRPTLIGRDQRKLDAAGAPHGLKTIRADLHGPETLARAFAGHRLVLNAAGPFRLTAGPLSDAAMAAGTDYIDVNGELLVLERLLNQSLVAGSNSRLMRKGVVYSPQTKFTAESLLPRPVQRATLGNAHIGRVLTRTAPEAGPLNVAGGSY